MQTDVKSLLGAYKRISIVGMCKNAGKTTALNRLIAACATERLGLSSIGRDGETSDLVTGTEKPAVFVPAGTVFATAEHLIPLCTVSRTVLSLSDFSTPLGRVAVLRAESAGSVQIAGPSTVEQMQRIVEEMQGFGAERVFIDGAIFRRSIASPSLCDAVVLAAGAAYSPDMQKTVTDTGFVCDILCLPPYEGEPGAHIVESALTDSVAEGILRGGPAHVTADDPSRVLLSPAMYARLARRGVKLCVRQRPALLFVTANPYSPYGAGFERAAFLGALRKRLSVPVLDVKETA